MIGKIFAGAVMLWFLSACATVDVVRSKAADGFDAGLVAAEQMTCNDASVGSIKRRYANTREGFQRWVNFCFSDGAIRDEWNSVLQD